MTVIVVSGIPGSGKTTLATALGEAMGLSVISKEGIKESLFDALGTGDNEWASTLSRAAHQTVLDLIEGLVGDVIVEAHFHTGTAEAQLRSLRQPLIQVWCNCPVEEAWRRYQIRSDHPDRHPGHLPEHQNDAATVGWRTRTPSPLSLDAPLMKIGTSGPVDISALCLKLRAGLAS